MKLNFSILQNILICWGIFYCFERQDIVKLLLHLRCGLDWMEVNKGATLKMGYKLNYLILKKMETIGTKMKTEKI